MSRKRIIRAKKSRTKYTRLNVRYTVREFGDVGGYGEETDVAVRALCLRLGLE